MLEVSSKLYCDNCTNFIVCVLENRKTPHPSGEGSRPLTQKKVKASGGFKGQYYQAIEKEFEHRHRSSLSS